MDNTIITRKEIDSLYKKVGINSPVTVGTRLNNGPLNNQLHTSYVGASQIKLNNTVKFKDKL